MLGGRENTSVCSSRAEEAILKEFYSLEENNIGKLSMRTGACKCICVNEKMHVFQSISSN